MHAGSMKSLADQIMRYSQGHGVTVPLVGVPPAKSGYDYKDVRESVAEYGYTAHIPYRGQDQAKRMKLPG